MTASLRPLRRRLALLATAGLAALALAGCGGGSSRAEAFVPGRLMLLGDENMKLVDDGSHDGFKYGINDRTASTAGKCLAQPTFAQTAVSVFGMVTAECNPKGAEVKAFMRGIEGARVADPTTGIAAQVAAVAGSLTSDDVVGLHMGVHDVVALQAQVAAGSLDEAAALAQARELGKLAATQTNALLETGARALVITIPDMSLSPYAARQEAAHPGAKALLRQLSREFNAEWRVNIDEKRFDGRHYGLVLADDVVGAMANYPASFLPAPSVINVGACVQGLASVTDCTTTTLVSGASVNSHLWADDLRLGPNAHSRIGLQLQSRVIHNPF